MPGPTPDVVVLAGPNGVGKSTSAPAILKDAMGLGEFVNADVIARGLSGFEPERAAMAAGRIMLSRLRELARDRRSFAFETTLASRSFAPWLAELVATGYQFHLVFLWLPSPDLAVARVAARVREGGHDVPEETIRRRYTAGLNNLSQLYQPMATSWKLCDNSVLTTTGFIAAGGLAQLRRGRGGIASILLDTDLIERAVHRAAIEATTRHQRLGNPIVVWRDGKVVRVPAEEIPIPGEATGPRP